MSARHGPVAADAAGLRIVVTGATSGIGVAVAQGLVDDGASVTIVGRDEGRCLRTVAQLRRRRPGAEVDSIVADLASIEETRRVVAEYCRRSDRLDVLINNAAAISKPRRLSSEGLELHVALNHISSFVLSAELLPLLTRSAELRGDGPTRIVNVSSGAHRVGVLWDDPQLEGDYEMFTAYGQSKALQLMCTFELARRLRGGSVTANAIDPGNVHTSILWKSGARKLGLLTFVLGRFNFLSAKQAAGPIIDLATSDDFRDVNGAYFDRSTRSEPHPGVVDPDDWARAWTMTERWISAADTPAPAPPD